MSRTKEFDGGLTFKFPVYPAKLQPAYVGIDQSYSGFAITALTADGKYFTWVHKPDGTGISRLVALRTFLDETLDLISKGYIVSDIAMEGYAYGAQMAHMAGELGGMIKLVLWDCEQFPLIVPPANLKKYVTGKGTGIQKNQMLLNIYKKWGIEFTDDNAADSYALARMAAGLSDLAYEAEVLAKLSDPKFRERAA